MVHRQTHCRCKFSAGHNQLDRTYCLKPVRGREMIRRTVMAVCWNMATEQLPSLVPHARSFESFCLNIHSKYLEKLFQINITNLVQTDPESQNWNLDFDRRLVLDHPNNSVRFRNWPFLMKNSALQHQNENFKLSLLRDTTASHCPRLNNNEMSYLPLTMKILLRPVTSLK